MRGRFSFSAIFIGLSFLATAMIGVFLVLMKEPAPPPPPVRFATPACRNAYARFFRKPAVDVRVVFGYKDARPARFVADRYERLIFVRKLLAPCGNGDFACGFTRSESDADLFRRSVLGPDGKPREVFLRVVQSSAGPDDQENRKDPYQTWRTQYASAAFFSGISNADAVFYNGHSRAGGGPDFQPPKIGERDEVMFGWYKEKEPGFNQTLAALKHEPSHLKMLGLFSCASSRLFLGRVREIRPNVGLVTSTKLIYFSDAMESALGTLSSLLGMKCEASYAELMKKPEIRAGGAQISGFF